MKYRYPTAPRGLYDETPIPLTALPAEAVSDVWFSAGRALFAVGVIALGLQALISSQVLLGLEPLPSWITERTLCAYVTGSLLIAAGVVSLIKKAARWGAIFLGAIFFLSILLLHLPKLVSAPGNGGAWTSAFEALAFGAAACVLLEKLSSASPGAVQLANVGRVCLGVSLLAFGILHFIYSAYVASVIPSWIPGHIFWAYFTGAAYVAAGLSMISGVKIRWAAIALGLMFASWVLIVHLPRVANNPRSRPEWTSLLICLAMSGAAWILAGKTYAKSYTR